MKTSKTTLDHGALITIQDAARELSCSPITIRRMLRAGRLRAIRLSQTLVRLHREDVTKLIEQAAT